MEAEWTEPESEEESKQERDREKTYGRITVRYEREFSGSTEGRDRQKDRTSLRPRRLAVPRRLEIAVFSLFIGFLGLWYLHIKKEENERKEERKDKK